MSERCSRCPICPTPGLPCSFEHLVRQAIRHGVVRSYAESPCLICLEMEQHRVEIDPFHARLLLCNRLRSEVVAGVQERTAESSLT